MIAPDDLALFTHTRTVEEAAEEVCGFYANYHSQRYVSDRLVLRLRSAPTVEQVARLNDEFADILASGTIDAIEATDAEVASNDHVDLPRLRLHFNRRGLGRLRQMIDTINGFAPEEGPSPSD